MYLTIKTIEIMNLLTELRISKLEKAVKYIRNVVTGIIVFLIITLIYAIANGLVNVQNLS